MSAATLERPETRTTNTPGVCHIYDHGARWRPDGYTSLCGVFVANDPPCCTHGYPSCGRPVCEGCEALDG